MPTVRLFENAAMTELDSPESLVQRVRDDDADFGWIDLTVDEEELLRDLAELFDVHELAVEDALSQHERPKLSSYDNHQVLTLSTTTFEEATGNVELQRLTAFVFAHFVVTVREASFPIDDVVELAQANGKQARSGVAYLVWAILDAVVDDHTETLEHIDDAVDELAGTIFGDENDAMNLQQRSFVLRRSLSRLQHTTAPLREVVNTLLRRTPGIDVDGLEPYFFDVYDHVLNTSDWADSVRDHLSSVLDTNLALQNNRMNETMKQVTSWAAIIAVPTAITGYFGQNFQFPGFDTTGGWWVSNAIIVTFGAVLYWVFRRNKWL